MNVRRVAARRPVPPTAWPATASAPFQARRRAATSPPLWTTSTSKDRDDSFATEAAASGASRRPPLAPELDGSEQRPTRGAGTCWLLLSTRMRASPPPGRRSRPRSRSNGSERRIAARAETAPCAHGRASARADEGTVIRGVICTDDGATRSAARSSQTSLPPASERNRRLTWPASRAALGGGAAAAANIDVLAAPAPRRHPVTHPDAGRSSHPDRAPGRADSHRGRQQS